MKNTKKCCGGTKPKSGWTLSKATKKKMRDAKLGVPKSETHKANISKAIRKFWAKKKRDAKKIAKGIPKL